MKPININYAYNGFLYAPLFVADKLGFFPKNMNLKFRDGDIPTIHALGTKNEPAENWFAICDPFAKDISSVQTEIGKDKILIVGSLIERLPVWLYNTNPDFEPVSEEDALYAHRHKIESVRCYKKFNTGYLIGERVRSKLDIRQDQFIECDFGAEFPNPKDDKALVVTSDILSLMAGIGNRNIVFAYPQKCPELDPFLFTGILTLKSVIDENLYSVLCLLAGLRSAIKELSAENIHPDCIQVLMEKFGPSIPHQEPSEKERQIRLSIDALFRTERIFSESFEVKNAEKAYQNARNEWQQTLGKEFPEAKVCSYPIPALLIKSHWEDDENLISFFVNRFRDRPRLWSAQLPKSSLVALWLTALIFVVSLGLSVYAWHHLAAGKGVYYFLAVFLFALQAFFSIFLVWDILWKFSSERIYPIGGLILGFFLAGLGIVVAL